jgi:hypothetical protein
VLGGIIEVGIGTVMMGAGSCTGAGAWEELELELLAIIIYVPMLTTSTRTITTI